MFDKIGADMSLYVMNAHQGQIFCPCDGLGLCNTYQQCAHQAGTVSNRHRSYIIQRQPRIGKRLADHLINFLNMLPGCDFRHHAAKQGVQVDLGGNHIGQYLSAVSHHRSRRLITGAFYS